MASEKAEDEDFIRGKRDLPDGWDLREGERDPSR
jgi:hypothetical protein